MLGVLSTLRARGDHYALLNTALVYLDNYPDDWTVSLQACQSYLALGLVGPARDLLMGLPGEHRLRPEVRGLCERILKMPSGRVAFGSLQARFDRNVDRLYERHPDMRRHDASLRSIPRRYELYKTADGNIQVARRLTGGRRRWIPDLCDVRWVVSNAKLPHDPNALFCGPYLVAGDRLGTLFERVFDATQKMFLTFTPRIYVVETDVDAFGIALFVSDAIQKLCDERVTPFVGPDCVERLASFFEGRPLLTAPEYAVRLTLEGEALSDKVHAALQPRAVALEAQACAVRDTVRRYYDSLPGGYWADRFRADREAPLRVLGITSRFTTYLQYSMRDWAAAFESRGHEFRILIEDNDHDLLPRSKTMEMIDELKPDLVVIIDHLRREYDPVIPKNVPFVCWIQDLLPNLENSDAGGSIGPLDFYISTDPTRYINEYGYPASQGLGWTTATDDRTYSHEPMAKEDLKPYRCDISFVSSHSTPPKTFHDERRQWFVRDPAALKLVDHLFDALSSEFADKPRTAFGAVEYIFEHMKEEKGLRPASTEIDSAVMNSYLYPIAELMFRQSTLEWVADYCDRTSRKLCIYGNGWDTHARFGRYACGFAQNGPQLRAIYQASTINLQIIGTGAVHQRLLDGLAAGGFFLIRYAPADVLHEPMARYLAAYRKYKPAAGVEYTREQIPDLVEAEEEISRLCGLNRSFDRTTVAPEVVSSYAGLEEMGFRRSAGAVFGEYGDISFVSASEFASLTDRYLSDSDERGRIVSSMRAAVVERHSYGALVDDLLDFIHRRLSACLLH